MRKKAVLIVNVGTPDKASLKEVRLFLREFLNDPLVIDLPWLLRKILVNLIIIPFRVKKSTALYQRLFGEKGSPILFALNSLAEKLQQKAGDEFVIFSAMRYGNPSLKEELKQIISQHFDDLILVPLFPQYAASTTGTITAFIERELNKYERRPVLKVIEQFYDQPEFIDAFAKQISHYQPSRYDHLLFTYHSLPISHVERVHPHQKASTCDCQGQMPEFGHKCYRATCYATTRLLAQKLNMPAGSYSNSFQSRLTRNWISPFSDEIIIAAAQNGIRNLLVAAPSFVADCLETIVEIEQDYEELFRQNGGEKLTLVRSLNDEAYWVDALHQIISRSAANYRK